MPSQRLSTVICSTESSDLADNNQDDSFIPHLMYNAGAHSVVCTCTCHKFVSHHMIANVFTTITLVAVYKVLVIRTPTIYLSDSVISYSE